MQNIQICGTLVEIDSKLLWNPQIDVVCKNLNAKLKKSYTMRLQSMKILESIYFTENLTSTLYSILVWGNSCCLQEVNKILSQTARFIKLTRKLYLLLDGNQLTFTIKKQLHAKHSKYINSNHHHC